MDATARTTADAAERLLTAAGWLVEVRKSQSTESRYLVCNRAGVHLLIRVSGHTKPGYSRMRRTMDTWETGPRFEPSLRRWLAKLL